MVFTDIRIKLLQRRDTINRRVGNITQQVRRADGPLPFDFSEQATERENDEVLDALGEAGRRELAQINRALARIDRGEYGICSSCGETIAEGRLAVLPFADLCIACADKRDAAGG